jgi:hypothetical protein
MASIGQLPCIANQHYPLGKCVRLGLSPGTQQQKKATSQNIFYQSHPEILTSLINNILCSMHGF